MSAQLDLFAPPAAHRAAHRIVPSALAGPQMRAIVAEVVAAGWDWGALTDFAQKHYGLKDDRPCCNDRWLGFCSMYHQAPDPNAAAFKPICATIRALSAQVKPDGE